MTGPILILGGYGNFGKRVAQNLGPLDGAHLIIAGRSLLKAKALCDSLTAANLTGKFEPLELDSQRCNFPKLLSESGAQLLINCSGPFQHQNYAIASAAIEAGIHYIDLADDRRFVCDFKQLDELARQNSTIAIAGASSVPGLSSTVIESFKDEFSEIRSIDIAIAPGNKAERGEATIAGILSYTGHPVKVWDRGRWQTRFGWMSPQKRTFAKAVGERWLANVDVPDLEIFPGRYKVAQRVTFQAGLELKILHFSMVAMAQLAKWGWLKDWSKFASKISRMSHWFDRWGSNSGGMQIVVCGRDQTGEDLEIIWNLTAPDGIGPYIPTLAATILAKQVIQGKISEFGAAACLNRFSIKDFYALAKPLGITCQLLRNGVNTGE